jgi:uncharacterized protein (TIGR03437 family)
VTVYESQPGIFELAAGDARVAAVIHQDGALVRPEAPARHGEIVSVFLTGAGLIAPLVPSGSIGPVPPSVTVLPIVVGIANMGMPVVFSGYAPGFIGLYQINFQIAGATPSGSFLTFNVKVGNSFSQDTTIAIAVD